MVGGRNRERDFSWNIDSNYQGWPRSDHASHPADTFTSLLLLPSFFPLLLFPLSPSFVFSLLFLFLPHDPHFSSSSLPFFPPHLALLFLSSSTHGHFLLSPPFSFIFIQFLPLSSLPSFTITILYGKDMTCPST